jgi:hypothetical protein
MGELLQLLRDEAVNLADSELPSVEELRPVVGAIVNRLQRLEQEVVGELKPAPAPAPAVEQPTFEQRGPAAPPAAPQAPAGPEPVQGPEPVVNAPTEAPAAAPAPEPVAGPASGVDVALEQAKSELAAAQARVAALEAQPGS